MKIKIVATTNIGLERENNEDAYLLCPDLSLQDWMCDDMSSYVSLGEQGTLVVVADGMGGANAGEIASNLALESVKTVFSKENTASSIKSDDYSGLLKQAIKVADDAINLKIDKDPDTSGMGTTIVICWIVNSIAHIAWCGDSRCYSYNPISGLKLLTKDHSYVQDLVDNGIISEQEAFNHPDSNIITRGLGDIQPPAVPDIISWELSSEDFLLLCSDGLSGYCTNSQIERVLDDNYIDITRCRDELLRLALDAGGYDNISIAIVSVLSNTGKELVPISFVRKIRKCFYRLFR